MIQPENLIRFIGIVEYKVELAYMTRVYFPDRRYRNLQRPEYRYVSLDTVVWC